MSSSKYGINRTYNFTIEGKAQIRELEDALNNTVRLLQDTQEELESTKRAMDELQMKYDFETSSSGIAAMRDNLETLQDTASRTATEFTRLIKAFNVDPSALQKEGFTYIDFINRLTEGSATFNQAATDFKREYPELIRDINSSLGSAIDTQMFNTLLTTVDGVVKSLEDLHTKVNEIGSAGGGGGGGGGIVDMSNAIEQLKDAAAGLPEEIRGSYEAITDLVNALTSLGSIDDNNIVAIRI